MTTTTHRPDAGQHALPATGLIYIVTANGCDEQATATIAANLTAQGRDVYCLAGRRSSNRDELRGAVAESDRAIKTCAAVLVVGDGPLPTMAVIARIGGKPILYGTAAARMAS